MSFLPARERALLSLSLALLAVTSCSSQSSPTNNDNAAQATVVSATPPFQTREPDRYRATRTITTVDTAGRTTITKTSIARDGELRRHESETEERKLVYLDVPEGRFVLSLDEKIFADLASQTSSSAEDQPTELAPERLIHAEESSTSYQNLGSEQLGGRNTTKYKTVVNSSQSANVTQSETSIWIDEELHMPIRSETTSQDGARVTMELSNIALDVDRGLFQVPNDYEKVTFAEFRKRLQKAKEPTSPSSSRIN